MKMCLIIFVFSAYLLFVFSSLLSASTAAEPVQLLQIFQQSETHESQYQTINALCALDGDQATDALCQCATHSFTLTQAVIVRKLGERGDAHALDTLVNIMQDEENGHVLPRNAATIALGELQDPRAIQPLIATVCSAWIPVRQAAITSLGMFGANAVAPLKRALQDADAKSKSWLVLALGATCDDEALKVLLPMAQEKDAALRACVVTALGNFHDDQALAVLQAALNDPDITVKMNAVMALGETGNAKAIPLLSEKTNDPDISIANLAMQALTKIPDPQTISLLSTIMVKGSSIKAIQAAASLKTLNDPTTVPLFVWLLTGRDATLQFASVIALAQQGSPDAVEPIASRLLKVDAATNTGRQLYVACIQALGTLHDPRGTDALLAVLEKEQNTKLQLEIIKALGAIGDSKAFEALLPFAKGQDAQLKEEALSAISTLHYASATDGLMALAADETIPAQLRARIVVAIGQTKDPKALIVLYEMLQSPTAELRVAAAKALGLLGDPQATDKLLPLLAEKGEPLPLGTFGTPYPVDTRSELRKAAIIALGQLQTSSATSKIFDLATTDTYLEEHACKALAQIGKPATELMMQKMSNPNLEIRLVATRGLGLQDDARAVPSLSKALIDKDATVRAAAAYSLGQLKAASAVPALVNALTDAEEIVRTRAACALWMIGGKVADDAVLAAIKSPTPDVRADIARGLKLAGDPRAIEPLLDLLTDDTPQVRCRAAHALYTLTGQDFGANLVRWKQWQAGLTK